MILSPIPSIALHLNRCNGLNPNYALRWLPVACAILFQLYHMNIIEFVQIRRNTYDHYGYESRY